MAPQAQQAPTKCHFITLPAEIRNKVYEYALAEEHGLQCVTGNVGMDRPHVASTPWGRMDPYTANNKDSTAPTPGPQADQLKLVNRQLHHEMRGLSFKYNVSFRCTDDVLRFLESFPLSQHMHLRELTILGQCDPAVLRNKTHDYRTSTGRALKQFARRNPQVLVCDLIKYDRADKRAYSILVRESKMQMVHYGCDDVFMNGI